VPRLVLNPLANGTATDWLFSGADEAWKTLVRDSGDSSFITSSVLSAKSTFDNDGASAPVCGFVTGITLYWRVKRTEPSTSGGLSLLVVQNGVERIVTTLYSIGTGGAWENGSLHIRDDFVSGQRFTSVDLNSLGVGASIQSLPAVGGFQLSELWLTVEYVDTPWFYDPFSGSLPDAIVGPKNMPASGTQPSALVGDFLRITDTSTVDALAYSWSPPSGYIQHRDEYHSELESALRVTALPAAPTAFACYASTYYEQPRGVDVSFFVDNGVQYIGLCERLGDHSDPSAYLAKVQYDYLYRLVHIRLTIDRNTDPIHRGKIKVYIDWEEEPSMVYDYVDVTPRTFPFLFVLLGTGTPHECTVSYDFIAWKTTKKDGNTFQSWEEFDLGTNEITLDSADTSLARIKVLDPPGVTMGQSDQALFMDVTDLNEECSIYQTWFDAEGNPTNYDLTIDYRGGSLIAGNWRVSVQRCSDLWYWDNIGSAWVSTYDFVGLPFSTTRTRLTAMSSILNSSPEGIIVNIHKPPAPIASISLRVYAVLLTK
jgi:hypothetical protein